MIYPTSNLAKQGSSFTWIASVAGHDIYTYSSEYTPLRYAAATGPHNSDSFWVRMSLDSGKSFELWNEEVAAFCNAHKNLIS